MKMVWRDWGAARVAVVIICAFCILVAGICVAWSLPMGQVIYSNISETAVLATSSIPVVTHLPTPEPLHGAYITACTASVRSLRNKATSIFNGSQLNAIAIDLKDYTGTVSYSSTKADVPAHSYGCRITDLPQFIAELHARGIYVIARITVFQDPLYAAAHPEVAIHSKANPQALWRDIKGLAYIDPGAPAYWDYIAGIAKEAYSIGFDEINFDYIRFPSDGNISDMYAPWSAGRTKSAVMSDFFMNLRERMAEVSVPLSVDLFGQTTVDPGDMGIGQVLEKALPYFDYVSPMVYPSHFASGFIGYTKPAMYPYEVVKYSMSEAAKRAIAASSSPMQLRPWLQAFDLGAVYTPAMVQAQIQATHDSGLTSWILWNAASEYGRYAEMLKE